MAENNLRDLMKDAFPLPDKEMWSQTAMGELNGDEPLTKLAWRDSNQNIFSPYYSAADTISLSYLQKFNLAPAKKSFTGNRAWINKPVISVANEVIANREALDHLSNGADGILYDISMKRDCNISQLLHDIEWNHCSVSFQNVDDRFSDHLITFLQKKNISLSAISGNLFWEKVPQKRITASLQEFGPLKSCGFFIKASTPVKEIAEALVSGVRFLKQSESNDIRAIFKHISFSLPVQPDFLPSTAKIKTLRILWYQVAHAYGLREFLPEDMHLHARSEKFVAEEFEPHGNVLSGTLAAMAAILGGCDSLTVYPQDEMNATMNRVARNIPSILREESFLNKVSDAVAGAYAIDVMVDTYARQAWADFQSTIAKE